jgi:hypothetical protein
VEYVISNIGRKFIALSALYSKKRIKHILFVRRILSIDKIGEVYSIRFETFIDIGIKKSDFDIRITGPETSYLFRKILCLKK